MRLSIRQYTAYALMGKQKGDQSDRIEPFELALFSDDVLACYRHKSVYSLAGIWATRSTPTSRALSAL